MVEPLPPPDDFKDWNEALQRGLIAPDTAPTESSTDSLSLCEAYRNYCRPLLQAGIPIPSLDEWHSLLTEPWTRQEEAALTQWLRWCRR